jgi:5-methylcytosine-specific restriction protein A
VSKSADAFVSDRRAFCDKMAQHLRKSTGSPFHDPKRWRDWYSHRRWQQRIRRAQLAREPMCEMCRANGRTTPADVVDHVREHHGDINEFLTGPLRSLCRPCHERRHGRGPGGKRPWIGVDGWPIEDDDAIAPAKPDTAQETAAQEVRRRDLATSPLCPTWPPCKSAPIASITSALWTVLSRKRARLNRRMIRV